MRWLRERLRGWLGITQGELYVTQEFARLTGRVVRSERRPRRVAHTHRLDTSPEHLAALAELLKLTVQGVPGPETPGVSAAGPSPEEEVQQEVFAFAADRGAEQLLEAARQSGTPITKDQALEYARSMLLGRQPVTPGFVE